MKQDSLKPSYIITGASFVLAFVCFVTIGCAIFYCSSIKTLQKQTKSTIIETIKNLEIKDKNQNKISIDINPEVYDKIDKISDDEYRSFLVQYNEHQSQWLNMWLTILSIALAFLGLIAPICFMKLYEDKKKEMDKIIDEANEQKKQAEFNVEEIKKQLDEAKKHEEKMAEDISEVKEYVNQAKALSKYNEGLNKLNKKEPEEARQLFLESIELNPKNDGALYQLALLEADKKEYEKALNHLKLALDINEKSAYFYDIGRIKSYVDEDCDEVIKYYKLAIEKERNKKIQGFYYSMLAVTYAQAKDKKQTNIAIKNALELGGAHYMICNNTANAYIRIGEYKKAIDIIKSSIKTKTDPSLYYNLIEAYIYDEQFENALAAIRKYITIEDKDSCWGIYEDDFKNWTKKLQKYKQNPMVPEIIKIINKLEKRERR